MRSRLHALLVLVATSCAAPSNEPPPQAIRDNNAHAPSSRRPGAVIDTGLLRRVTEELSSDDYEGRGTGTAGGRRTVQFVASHMKSLGLAPGAPTFLQPVFLRGSLSESVSLRLVNGRRSADLGGVIAHSESPPGQYDWSLPIVFVGYGIDTEPGWDDYAGLDVAGKIVVALVGEPDAPPFRGRPLSAAGRWTAKLERARAHGAAGCLVVHTPDAGYDWPVVQASFSGERFELEPTPSVPLALRGWLSTKTFEQLSGRPLPKSQRAASEPSGATRTLDGRLEASYGQRTRRIQEHNVVGKVGSGTEPVVVVTAHWDHLGRVQNPAPREDPIFNGAIDNASGVAAMLALAAAVERRHQEHPIAGTIYFVATAAEEQGLLGSEAFARELPVPVESIAAAINFDGMNVGSATPTLELVAPGLSTLDALFGSALARQGRAAVPDRAPQSGAAYRSDHAPFVRLGIPVLYPTPGFAGSAALVAAGEERTARYHAVSDDFDPAWSFEGATRDSEAIYEVVLDIADGKVRPRMLGAVPSPTSP